MDIKPGDRVTLTVDEKYTSGNFQVGDYFRMPVSLSNKINTFLIEDINQTKDGKLKIVCVAEERKGE